jgi:hypothetical protein
MNWRWPRAKRTGDGRAPSDGGTESAAALRKLAGCRVTLVRPCDVRYGSPHSEPLDLDFEFLEGVADLARRQAEDPGRLGLHPAGALHGIDQALAFRRDVMR